MPPYVSTDSLSQVQFPSCQFYQSEFGVATLSDFRGVLLASLDILAFSNDGNASEQGCISLNGICSITFQPIA